MTDEPKRPTQWFSVEKPFSFGLSTKGELMIEWEIAVPEIPGLSSKALPPVLVGVLVPAKEVKNLMQCLEGTKTIRETLSAKEPERGAH